MLHAGTDFTTELRSLGELYGLDEDTYSEDRVFVEARKRQGLDECQCGKSEWQEFESAGRQRVPPYVWAEIKEMEKKSS